MRNGSLRRFAGRYRYGYDLMSLISDLADIENDFRRIKVKADNQQQIYYLIIEAFRDECDPPVKCVRFS